MPISFSLTAPVVSGLAEQEDPGQRRLTRIFLTGG
jgi:hypothetical protein